MVTFLKCLCQNFIVNTDWKLLKNVRFHSDNCWQTSTVPSRGSIQVLVCSFPGVLLLWHFLNSVGPHPVSSLHTYTFVVSRALMAGAASKAGDADSSRAPGLTSGFQGSVKMSTVVLYCWYRSDSSSLLLYFTHSCNTVYDM